MTELIRSRLPEEEELQRKDAELLLIEVELAEAEAKLADLRGDLERFRLLFHRRCAGLFAELDELRAEITRRRAAQAPSDDNWQQLVEEAERQAQESRQAANEAINVDSAKPPSEELKSAFRAAARKVHPDLATDDSERKRRTEVMSRINAAYARGDLSAISRILEDEETRPERVEGDGIAERLIRVLRKIAQARRRLREVAEEMASIQADSLWELFQRYLRDGAQVLDELEERLQSDLGAARLELSNLQEL